jgi:beta-phosphoglucomutase-like phosphatase (HAD superfamily)
MEKIIFWDMDGVLIDSLGLDFQVVNPILEKKYGPGHEVSREFIRSKFALAIPEFIRDILLEVGQFNQPDWAWMVEEYERLRVEASYDLCPGAIECLQEAQRRGYWQWVVSNNKESDIDTILQATGIRDFFTQLWGYDAHPQIAKKPAPDIYLGAFDTVMVDYPDSEYVVVEDSAMGVQSAVSARAERPDLNVRVVGVTTGGDVANDLQQADEILTSLEQLKF